MWNALNNYLDDHVSPSPEPLDRLERHTQLHHVYGRMCSGNVQGRLLKILTAMLQPRRVLELGTFTGYSALCIAEGLPADGELHSVEIDDEWEDEIRDWWAQSPYGSKITLHIGDAMEVVPRISAPEMWDMVLIDANKRLYTDYYEMVLPLLRPGGIILADNTLWSDKVLAEPAGNDAQTRGIMAFNDLVARDKRVETAIIPLRDGLSVIRKL